MWSGGCFTAECIPVQRFDPRDLVLGQPGEFPRPSATGQRAAVLAQESQQKAGHALRHVDDQQRASQHATSRRGDALLTSAGRWRRQQYQ